MKKKLILFRSIYIDTPWRIIIGLLAIIVLTAINAVSFRYGVKLETINSMYYNEKSDLDYKVYLKQNDYFDEQFLGKDRQYIASIIDYISTDFTYNLVASKKFDYTYKYWVTANLVAKEKGEDGKVVYDKEYPLVDVKEVSLTDSNSFAINENVKIDYGYYNSIMESFRKDYGLSMESNLVVKLHVEFLGNEANIKQDIASNQEMELTIPLTEQTINVGMDYNKINDYEVVEESSNTEIVNKVLFAICIISLILDIIVVIEYVRFLEKIKKSDSLYNKKLHKIMKEYDRAIVKTRAMPDIDDLKIIEVETFEELIDARENLEKPILFIDINPGQKSCFLIINDRDAYKFMLKEKDLEEELAKKKKAKAKEENKFDYKTFMEKENLIDSKEEDNKEDNSKEEDETLEKEDSSKKSKKDS